MDLDEHSEYTLFVGAAEWNCDPGEDNRDLFVEVKVDGASEVVDLRPNPGTKLSKFINIEIKSVARTSSESLSIARADASLGNLLETCAYGDAAALELTIAPLMLDTLEQVAVTDVGGGSK
ncbi:hypothetical protein FIBSPDRAFT_949782 [Athelia psychrophila]|uniref:Uncharacterized protein n=1 Tax=Athelia psychrophila TaxID=1759441 RepID=A0A166PDS9_9AGAM|nr:hypothetical protein FIBSPDRAFT_949782 [Fibularhizoctonia sp. CBS 109695]